jgi:hypothetical protein
MSSAVQESKKATDLEVDELSFDDDAGAGAAGSSAAPPTSSPSLTFTHYARCPSGKALPAWKLRALEATRNAGGSVRLFLGRTHQLRRFFIGAHDAAAAAPASAQAGSADASSAAATAGAASALPVPAPARTTRAAASAAAAEALPWNLYLADCRLVGVEQRPDGTLVMRLREAAAPLPACCIGGADVPTARAHELLLRGDAGDGEGALRAHGTRVAAHNAALLQRRTQSPAPLLALAPLVPHAPAAVAAAADASPLGTAAFRLGAPPAARCRASSALPLRTRTAAAPHASGAAADAAATWSRAFLTRFTARAPDAARRSEASDAHAAAGAAAAITLLATPAAAVAAAAAAAFDASAGAAASPAAAEAARLDADRAQRDARAHARTGSGSEEAQQLASPLKRTPPPCRTRAAHTPPTADADAEEEEEERTVAVAAKRVRRTPPPASPHGEGGAAGASEPATTRLRLRLSPSPSPSPRASSPSPSPPSPPPPSPPPAQVQAKRQLRDPVPDDPPDCKRKVKRWRETPPPFFVGDADAADAAGAVPNAHLSREERMQIRSSDEPSAMRRVLASAVAVAGAARSRAERHWRRIRASTNA